MLRFAPVNGKITTIVSIARTGSLLSNGKYREALSVAQNALSEFPKMASDDREELELDTALAEAHLGLKEEAARDLANLQEEAKSDDPIAAPKVTLAIAELNLLLGFPQQAHTGAALATTHFAAAGQLDSTLQSACVAALASKEIKNQGDFGIFSAKAIDTASQIQQTWKPQASQTYFSRPDLQLLMREVPVSVHAGR
jgi:hypothetical protein